MKHALRFTFVTSSAVAVFAAGVLAGRAGLVPDQAMAQPASPVLERSLLHVKGSSGGTLSWEQLGATLQMTVTGTDAAFLGVAALSDVWAWPAHFSGDAEVLYPPGTSFELDLSMVEALTFFRLEPIATLHDGVFIPCEDLPIDCFPIRNPDPPPFDRFLAAGWH